MIYQPLTTNQPIKNHSAVVRFSTDIIMTRACSTLARALEIMTNLKYYVQQDTSEHAI
jgi:hypothetical protein